MLNSALAVIAHQDNGVPPTFGMLFPMSHFLFLCMSVTATTPSSADTAMEPTASQYTAPVTCRHATGAGHDRLQSASWICKIHALITV